MATKALTAPEPPIVTHRTPPPRSRELRAVCPDGPSPAVDDDPQLLAAYVAGDHLAFHTLVERHEKRVYAVCYRYFGDRGDAEDATQDTFVALARHASAVRGTAKLSTWLYRVAVNACHDIARRRARRPLAARREPPDIAEAFDRVAYRETEIDLQSALAHLDATSRAALVLVAFEHCSYAEAAEIVGMSVPAIRSRIHRARARLADILDDAA